MVAGPGAESSRHAQPVEERYATPRARRAAARLFAHKTGTEPATPDGLAAASGRLLDSLSQGLAQVIGPAGVRAILLRAVRLRKTEFAFLNDRVVPGEGPDSLAETLRACLREQEPEVIREVAVTLFATFAGLLAAIIGDRLAWSLFEQIWADALPPGGDLEEAEE